MSRFDAAIAEQIWDMKYRLKDADGIAIDKTVEDTWTRIAKDLASVETDKELWEKEFYAALENFKFLSRTIAHLRIPSLPIISSRRIIFCLH